MIKSPISPGKASKYIYVAAMNDVTKDWPHSMWGESMTEISIAIEQNMSAPVKGNDYVVGVRAQDRMHFDIWGTEMSLRVTVTYSLTKGFYIDNEISSNKQRQVQ